MFCCYGVFICYVFCKTWDLAAKQSNLEDKCKTNMDVVKKIMFVWCYFTVLSAMEKDARESQRVTERDSLSLTVSMKSDRGTKG